MSLQEKNMLDLQKLKTKLLYRGVPCALLMLIARYPDDLYFDIALWQIAVFSVFISLIAYKFDK